MLADEILNKKLVTDKPSNLDIKFNDIWDFVEQHCSAALNIYRSSGDILYRGVNMKYYNKGPGMFLGQNRKNRRLVNGSSVLYGKICDLFLKTAGFKALRGSSIFCGSKNTSNYWGSTVYMIFPFNGFNYTYSMRFSGIPAKEYLYPFNTKYEQNNVEILLQKYFNNKSNKMPIEKEKLKQLSNEFIKLNDFRQNRLDLAIESGQDVWFNRRYIAFKKLEYEDLVSNRL